MATCKWCDRSGWLLSVSEDGLCRSCLPIVHLDVTQRLRILQESTELAEKGKSLDTRLSRCDLAIEHARALLKYEEKGLDVLSAPPSKLLAELEGERTRLIVNGLKAEIETARQKAGVASTARTKLNALSKALFRIQGFRSQPQAPPQLQELEGEVAGLIHETQLNDYLDSARKAEFRGQPKKALEKYYEALHFLRNDKIDDRLQIGNIQPVEAKIRELGGEVR